MTGIEGAIVEAVVKVLTEFAVEQTIAHLWPELRNYLGRLNPTKAKLGSVETKVHAILMDKVKGATQVHSEAIISLQCQNYGKAKKLFESLEDRSREAFNCVEETCTTDLEKIHSWVSITQLRMLSGFMSRTLTKENFLQPEEINGFRMREIAKCVQQYLDELLVNTQKIKKQRFDEFNAVMVGKARRKKEMIESFKEFDNKLDQLLQMAYPFLSEGMNWTNSKLPMDNLPKVIKIHPKYIPEGKEDAAIVNIFDHQKGKVQLYKESKADAIAASKDGDIKFDDEQIVWNFGDNDGVEEVKDVTKMMTVSIDTSSILGQDYGLTSQYGGQLMAPGAVKEKKVKSLGMRPIQSNDDGDEGPSSWSFKVCLKQGQKSQVKMIALERSDKNQLSALKSQLKKTFPALKKNKKFSCYWVDEDGDDNDLDTSQDLETALDQNNDPKFKIYIRMKSDDDEEDDDDDDSDVDEDEVDGSSEWSFKVCATIDGKKSVKKITLPNKGSKSLAALKKQILKTFPKLKGADLSYYYVDDDEDEVDIQDGNELVDALNENDGQGFKLQIRISDEPPQIQSQMSRSSRTSSNASSFAGVNKAKVNTLTFKATLKDDPKGKLKKVSVKADLADQFEALKLQLSDAFPALKEEEFTISYLDEEGDEIQMESNEDMQSAVEENGGQTLKLILETN